MAKTTDKKPEEVKETKVEKKAKVAEATTTYSKVVIDGAIVDDPNEVNPGVKV